MNIDVSVRSRLSWGPFKFLFSGFQVLVFKTKRSGRETNPHLYLTNYMVQIFLHNIVVLQSRNFLRFMQPEGSLTSSQNPPILFTLNQRNAVHSHHISLTSILILSSLLQGFPIGHFSHGSPPRTCMSLFCPPYVPHSLPISYSRYLVRSTNQEALRHSVSSSPRSPRRS